MNDDDDIIPKARTLVEQIHDALVRSRQLKAACDPEMRLETVADLAHQDLVAILKDGRGLAELLRRDRPDDAESRLADLEATVARMLAERYAEKPGWGRDTAVDLGAATRRIWSRAYPAKSEDP
jgi:hypothetical protein